MKHFTPRELDGGQKGGAFEKKGLIVKTNADLFITTVKIFAVFMLCL